MALFSHRPWLILVILCLPVLLVSMDVSILFFAAPHIAASLRPSAVEQLWIFDMYGFVLAGFLLTMGAVSDRFGRRRVLLLGAAGFGLASMLAAFAPTAGWLIAARALLGLGGATLMPSTLAIIRTVFTDEAARAKAVGIWAAVLAGGTGLGPVVAGLLLAHFSWGSVFLINVPIILILLAVGPVLLPESRDPSTKVDLASSILSLVAVLSLVQAVKEVAANGWTPSLIVLVPIATATGYGFVRRQLTAAAPMVDPGLFRRPGFAGAVLLQLVAMAAMLGNAVMITQYLQSVLGLSALVAALWSLVPTVFVGAAAPSAASIAQRVGPPAVIAGSFALSAAGFLLYLALTPSSPIWLVLVAATPISMGVVSVSTIVTDYAISVAPGRRAASVAAITETASEFGGALGMAVLGSILTAAYTHAITPNLPAGLGAGTSTAAGTLAGAIVAAEHVAGTVGTALLTAARDAYIHAMQTTGLVTAGILFGSAALTARLLRRPPKTPPEAAQATAPSKEDRQSSSTGSQASWATYSRGARE